MASSARLAAALALLLPACVAPFDRAAEEQALHELWRQFEAAFNAGDAEACASLYAEDADRVSSKGVRVAGRAAIAAGYAELLARRQADPTTRPFRAVMKVRLLTEDVGIMDGEWQGAREGLQVRGQFTLTARKRAGVWRIVAGRDRGIIGG